MVDEDEDEDTELGATKVEGNPASKSAASKKPAPKAIGAKVASKSKMGNVAMTASTDSTVYAGEGAVRNTNASLLLAVC